MHRAYAAAPRLAASKCSLLARVDAYGQDPSGEVRIVCVQGYVEKR
jgi:RNA processing factor Prp31